MGHRARRLMRLASKLNAESAATTVGVAGWLLITAFVHSLTDGRVWFLSVGLLALACPGLKPAALILWLGVYHLSKAARPKE